MSLRLFTMLTLTILNVQTLLGQITGNTNTRDPRAKQISHEYRDALCGKEWICLKLIEIRRGVRDEYDQHGRIVEFGPDGQFKCSPKYDGTWTIVDDQFIKISLSTFSKNVKPLLNGAYSIYALSDSTLVLGQILTSSGDFTREYTFTSSSTISASSRHPMVYKHPVDSLKEGKQIKHYSNGQVMSVEQLKLARKKITAEDLFLNYHKPFHDRYNAADSTLLRSVAHGEWTYYYPDGKIQAKYYYNEGTPIGRWVRFFPDGRLDETENYDDNGMLKFSDSYQYGKDKLWPIIEREAPNKQVVFVIGSKDSVQFNQIEFYETGQADSNLEKKIAVRNLSGRKVTIVIPHNTLFDTKSTEVEVNPDDSIVLNLSIKIPAGVTD
ncbi:MAG TPA: hypothetical protein VFZ52_00565, partial [Chryseolinea sp.]